jgi:hypothetical protein
MTRRVKNLCFKVGVTAAGPSCFAGFLISVIAGKSAPEWMMISLAVAAIGGLALMGIGLLILIWETY